MNKAEMHEILADHLSQYRDKMYSELRMYVESKYVYNAYPSGPDGTPCQVEINFLWDNKRGSDIRVMGSIDESPHRPLWGFIPIYFSAVTDSFIMRPDGTFVDEV